MILNNDEFSIFQKLIFDAVGINLDNSKKTLIESRLLKRLLFYKITNYSEYLNLIKKNPTEQIEVINQITTNETYFFRESTHFDFIKKIASNLKVYEKMSIWSAASSVGAEAYSLAMILDNILNRDCWTILGTDINTEVIKKAKIGLYPENWINKIPPIFRKKYCLKGKNSYQGFFLIDNSFNERVNFQEGNLLVQQTNIGKFDIIFLRNVLIYFDVKTRKKIIYNVIANLKQNGYFIISLTENLQNINIPELKQVQSSIYQKII